MATVMHATGSAPGEDAPDEDLRPAAEVMDLGRLGCGHQSRLSFVRSLVRQMCAQRWRIRRLRFDLDSHGCGKAIYRVETRDGDFDFVVFADKLRPEERSDRVIAERWDLTCALCQAPVDDAYLAELAANVPRQEAGRCDSRVLVLSRANRSARNFDAVLDRLAAGEQPDPAWFARVGYLYRTTAVYGNGKFGIADFARLQRWPAFARPFSAQMLTVYLVRAFSLDQIEHMARCRSPRTAVPMDRSMARYLGIGNSTGLGMAPFLIRHPRLINRWVWNRERGLARVLTASRTPSMELLHRLEVLTRRARTHVAQWLADDPAQQAANQITIRELGSLLRWIRWQRRHAALPDSPWRRLFTSARRRWSVETQELLVSLLLELHPELVDPLEDDMLAPERDDLRPDMSAQTLKQLVESRYVWALAYDFDQPDQMHYFWYRSEEKEEPRLGVRHEEPGAEREMDLGIARLVAGCHRDLAAFLRHQPEAGVVDFLIDYPQHRGIVRRVQNVGDLHYGEVRANLLAADCLPIHLLRCKLAFFGATKFDPRSDRWVRITLFQGAPLPDELHHEPDPDWCFPVMPEGGEATGENICQ